MQFQQWNPSKANQETDAAYAADSLRSGGAPSGGILPAATFNKLAYQLTTFVAAFAQALAAKGVTLDDSDMNNLAGLFANVIIASDLVPYAPLNSPVFSGTPKAPTPSANADPQEIATVGWVAGLSSFANSGYQKFANGLIIQWGILPQVTISSSDAIFSSPLSWPIAFPHTALAAFACDRGASCFTISIGNLNSTGATQWCQSGRHALTGPCSGTFFAIGY